MAGFDGFLKLDGIDGESTTKGHEKEIEADVQVQYDLAPEDIRAALRS
jgi:type VI protein secretion system component Hcp